MLAPAVRQKMEAVFRQRFNDVRVHVQPLPQPQFAGAAALTQGSHIYFAPGCYNPLTSEGERILAHELAHVVQQRSGRVRNPSGSGVAVVRNTVLDAEAERMAGDAATFQPRTAQRIAGHRARASIQCAFILRNLCTSPPGRCCGKRSSVGYC